MPAATLVSLSRHQPQVHHFQMPSSSPFHDASRKSTISRSPHRLPFTTPAASPPFPEALVVSLSRRQPQVDHIHKPSSSPFHDANRRSRKLEALVATSSAVLTGLVGFASRRSRQPQVSRLTPHLQPDSPA